MPSSSQPRRSRSPTAVFLAANPALGQLQIPTAPAQSAASPQITTWADGKGVNAARAFTKLGGHCDLVFLQGSNDVERLLQLLRREAIPAVPVPFPGSNRRSFLTLAELRHSLPEVQSFHQGSTVPPAALRELADRFQHKARSAQYCAIAGSLPPGAAVEFYRDLIRDIRKATSCSVALDAKDESLRSAIDGGPHIVKVNRLEASHLLGLDFDPDNKSHISTLSDYARLTSVRTFLITSGARRTVAWSRDLGILTAKPPEVNVTNTVGAGDTFLASFLFASRLAPPKRLAYAVAAATASVTSLTPGDLLLSRLKDCLAEVIIDPLDTKR